MSTSLGAVFLAGRILFAIFFVPLSGVGHIRRGTMMIGYAKSTGMPLPSLAGWPSGVWLIAGGVSVAAGLWADLGALMLGLFVTLAALQFHRFWAIEDESQRSTQKQSFGATSRFWSMPEPVRRFLRVRQGHSADDHRPAVRPRRLGLGLSRPLAGPSEDTPLAAGAERWVPRCLRVPGEYAGANPRIFLLRIRLPAARCTNTPHRLGTDTDWAQTC